MPRRLRRQKGFQSTPPRRRRPRRKFITVVARRISIHASAKEATRGSGSNVSTYLDFNPRLREGGDPDSLMMVTFCFPISIHASAKEATAVRSHRLLA